MVQGMTFFALSNRVLFIAISLQVKEGLLATRDQIKVGPVTEFDSFMSAVIDDKAFKRIKGYIDEAKNSKDLKILGGGQYDDR